MLRDKFFWVFPAQRTLLAADIRDKSDLTVHGELDVGIALTAFCGRGWAGGFGEWELLPDRQPYVGLFVGRERCCGRVGGGSGGWCDHGGLCPFGSWCGWEDEGVCVLWWTSLKLLVCGDKRMAKKSDVKQRRERDA